MKRILEISALLATVIFSFSAHAQTIPYGATTGNSTILPDTNELLVYPNPTTDNARVVVSNMSIAAVEVKIINMNGTLMRTQKFEPGATWLDIDMSRLPGGIYSVRLYGKSVGFYNLKIMKQ